MNLAGKVDEHRDNIHIMPIMESPMAHSTANMQQGGLLGLTLPAAL